MEPLSPLGTFQGLLPLPLVVSPSLPTLLAHFAIPRLPHSRSSACALPLRPGRSGGWGRGRFTQRTLETFGVRTSSLPAVHPFRRAYRVILKTADGVGGCRRCQVVLAAVHVRRSWSRCCRYCREHIALLSNFPRRRCFVTAATAPVTSAFRPRLYYCRKARLAGIWRDAFTRLVTVLVVR